MCEVVGTEVVGMRARDALGFAISCNTSEICFQKENATKS